MMGVGLSDGTSYDDNRQWLAETLSAKQVSDRQEIAGNEATNDFQSRFLASNVPDTSGIPPEALRKAAGEFKQPEGSQPPDNSRNIKINADPRVNVDITPQDIDSAISVGLSAGPGTMAGVKGIGNLKGAAKNEALSNLGYAQVLEANGAYQDVIAKKTGFQRGADSRWRWEIDDSKAKFFPENVRSNGTFLSEVYSHPELYAAYPHLKYTRLFTDPELAGASYNSGMGFDHIMLGDKPMWNGRVASKDPGILAHEIQHAIQEHEGFAKGASYPGSVETNPKGAKYYTRSAGEVEARNVDTRLELTAQERRDTPPFWTEDIPRYNQLVTKGVGVGTEQGLEDSMTGKMMSKDVTNFRRAANDNKSIAESVEDLKKDLPVYGDIVPLADVIKKERDYEEIKYLYFRNTSEFASKKLKDLKMKWKQNYGKDWEYESRQD